MTAPQTSAGRDGRGSAPRPAEHHVTDAHWAAAAAAVTTGGNERDTVHRVATAIADAEQLVRDDVRFGSAYCPDCGEHCDRPHALDCPLLKETTP